MLQIRARARPIWSARAPNSTPPKAEVNSVNDATAPASAELRWNSPRIAVSANAYSITSVASSVQPSWAAHSVRHCSRVMELYQGIDPRLLFAQQFQGAVETGALEADRVARPQLSHGVQV